MKQQKEASVRRQTVSSPKWSWCCIFFLPRLLGIIMRKANLFHISDAALSSWEMLYFSVEQIGKMEVWFHTIKMQERKSHVEHCCEKGTKEFG